jgi:hypothetical protein
MPQLDFSQNAEFHSVVLFLLYLPQTLISPTPIPLNSLAQSTPKVGERLVS